MLPLALDFSSAVPPDEQLTQQLAAFAEAGLLHSPHQLPSVRELAVRLNVPPSVVEAAYRCWQYRSLAQILAPSLLKARLAGYDGAEIRNAVELLLQPEDLHNSA